MRFAHADAPMRTEDDRLIRKRHFLDVDKAVGSIRPACATEAEASLAEALCAGVTPGDYALTRSVSLNTVYTHLRRIKDKTRCRRMPELIRKLNDTVAPARHE